MVVGIQTLGKNVLVAGRSKNVGMPIAMLLHTDGRHERPGGPSEWTNSSTLCAVLYYYKTIGVIVCLVSGDATVTISHRYTPREQLRQHTKIADIIVAAAGSHFSYRIKPLSFPSVLAETDEHH